MKMPTHQWLGTSKNLCKLLVSEFTQIEKMMTLPWELNLKDASMSVSAAFVIIYHIFYSPYYTSVMDQIVLGWYRSPCDTRL